MTARASSRTQLVLALVAAGVLGGAGATWITGTRAQAAPAPVAATEGNAS